MTSNSTITDTAPNVWIGCLACYNEGHLVGEWVPAAEAASFVPCERSTFGSPHEEWWVMDHEHFHGFLRGECSPMEAQAIAELMGDVDATHVPLDAAAAWYANQGYTNVDEMRDRLPELVDAYLGQYDSLQAYLEESYAELLDALPEWVQAHADALMRSITRDVQAGGELTLLELPDTAGVYIFTH